MQTNEQIYNENNKIASKVFVDNKNKSVCIEFTDGSKKYTGFNIFDDVV